MRSLLTLISTIFIAAASMAASPKSDYVVLASRAVAEDAEWCRVVESLSNRHNAEVVYFESMPREAVKQLKHINPRYVAIVDMPENIGRDYVIDFHHVSRDIDKDIYADFMWGIITGYDAKAAMRMVENSHEPLVIKSAVATIMELNSAKWFDNYAWVDDHTKGLWGEKRGRDGEIATGMVASEQVLCKFTELYAAYDPDLIVTAAHATQKNLEMPYSLGNLKPRDGRLYAEDRFTKEVWDLEESGKRRVYAAVGNCLIGDMNNTRESMAAAWMNGSNVATMVGYVVTTWHGRNGWGALKYWVTNPERYTLAESVYINQQDFLYQQNEWYPTLIDERYNYCEGFEEELTTAANRLAEVLGRELSFESAEDWDMIGFWHDRDVLVYYGDPKWEVRLQPVAGEQAYEVKSERRGKEYIVTITTGENFSLERMRGDKFKQEHVLNLPFSYIFPERLKSPQIVDDNGWKCVVDENFLLIYDAPLEPSSKYEIVIKTK
jgi:zinc protease